MQRYVPQVWKPVSSKKTNFVWIMLWLFLPTRGPTRFVSLLSNVMQSQCSPSP